MFLETSTAASSSSKISLKSSGLVIIGPEICCARRARVSCHRHQVAMLTILALLLGGVECRLAYCSSDLSVPLPVNASGKTLVFVTAIHRHGDRTPVYPLIVADNVEWNCTLQTIASTDLMSSSDAVPLGRIFRRQFAFDEEALPGNCEFGQLTETGDGQHSRLGAAYRSKYVSVLRFLPPVINSSIMWLRSTSYSRTFASLAANMRGLYPPKTRRDGKVDALSVNTRDQDREYLTGGDGRACPLIGDLLSKLEKTGAFDVVNKALDALVTVCNDTFGQTDLTRVHDHGLARACTKLPQIGGLTDDLLEQIDGNLTIRYYMRRSTLELQKYSIGPFFYEVALSAWRRAELGVAT
jgi:hypothetical protein